MTPSLFMQSALRTIEMESKAIQSLSGFLDPQFPEACQALMAIRGKIVVTGMGKSGHIGKKIAATLASTGSPAFFVHPGEASHGDIGMIAQDDAVIAMSNSGETPEVLSLIPAIKRIGVPLIALTGSHNSSLSKQSDFHLYAGVEEEACPLNLAPTSSTTATLVMGDALAIALLEARGFTAEDFAFSHPSGSLGKRLLLKVEDIMHAGVDVPKVTPQTKLKEALFEISDKKLGMTSVVDDNGSLLGVFTDGDLRRALDKDLDIKSTSISQCMHSGAATIDPGKLAAEALYVMEEKKITSLIVLNEQNQPVGVVHLHDLLKAGVA